MKSLNVIASLVVTLTLAPAPAMAQINFPKTAYYRIPHPVPGVFAQLEAALMGFDQALRALLPLVHVPPRSRVEMVDLYGASLDHDNLVTIERRLGFTGSFDFDVHPTNLGHTFIANQFEQVWKSLP